jgi:3-methyl-2-oxobutanoate hydroxymethyltransferase
MGKPKTVHFFAQAKSASKPIVCLTAYDALDAELCELAEVDCVLVGDSVANARLGFPTTVHADLDMMVHHVSAVRRGLITPFLVADMPFGSYGISVAQTCDHAARLMKAGANAVKLENDYTEEIAALVKMGIPVMGHVGMTPQSVHAMGGFRVQGREEEDAQLILEKALSIEKAGAFAIVLELVPAQLAIEITSKLTIPTIGIGAGSGTSGQIQVITDILGLGAMKFKHARAFVDGRALFLEAIKAYATDTKSGSFPNEENAF